MIDFSGKTVIVTGAGRGIGAGIAQTMAKLGAAVVLVDVDAEAASGQAESIVAGGGMAGAQTGDVLDKSFLDRVVAETLQRREKVDVLVNNVGIIRDNYLENITEADWDLVLDVNLKGAFFSCQAVAPIMKERRYGKIVNIISKAWLGTVGQTNYSASKGGLVSLTRTLALELAPYEINVNGVAPGLIDTPMTRNLPEKVKERVIKMQPTGKMGTTDDVAAAVCFLASDLAGFITGQILHVDGGKSCGLLSI
ncbi:MAG: SDR family oxidoreductase [Candidatus Krumholzibacteria bacterium]|nr:SDR family oxidoreductase [Candidatus Krumholzibacteria bacterium]